MKKIGIMGGSFDPCHRGHINLALDAARQADLTKVILMPARVQPFKIDAKTAGNNHRLNMLKAAVENIAELEVSDWEMRQEELSYTYLTMREAKRQAGDETQVFFISGTDSFLEISRWKNSEELISENRFIVGVRPGYREDELEAEIKRLSELYGTEIIKIDNRRFHISSTEIRERLRDGKDISDLVTPGVERYITEHGLYIK